MQPLGGGEQKSLAPIPSPPLQKKMVPKLMLGGGEEEHLPRGRVRKRRRMGEAWVIRYNSGGFLISFLLRSSSCAQKAFQSILPHSPPGRCIFPSQLPNKATKKKKSLSFSIQSSQCLSALRLKKRRFKKRQIYCDVPFPKYTSKKKIGPIVSSPPPSTR